MYGRLRPAQLLAACNVQYLTSEAAVAQQRIHVLETGKAPDAVVFPLEHGGGFPDRVIKNVLGGVDVGRALSDHPEVDKVTFTGSVAYTDAKYTMDVTNATPSGTPSYVVHNGDPLPISKWQYAVGVQYDFRVVDRFGAYVRADGVVEFNYMPAGA